MKRPQIQKLSRKWHRILGPLIGVQLLLWTLGGIYFSWFDLDNVHGDYERAEQAIPDLREASVAVSLEMLLERSDLARVEEVRLGTFLDRTVVRLYQDRDRVEMYDATSGERLSPIGEADARAIAKVDFAPPGEIVSVQLIEEKRGEYKNAVPAWQVRFDNWKRTHVYVHANTGLVTARRNAIWRGFDFLWMLHILDFRERENFNNWLLRILSLLSLITIVTGYVLWLVTTPLLRRGRRSGERRGGDG
jgi:uncharacterized iron-regulated membrane protein